MQQESRYFTQTAVWNTCICHGAVSLWHFNTGATGKVSLEPLLLQEILLFDPVETRFPFKFVHEELKEQICLKQNFSLPPLWYHHFVTCAAGLFSFITINKTKDKLKTYLHSCSGLEMWARFGAPPTFAFLTSESLFFTFFKLPHFLSCLTPFPYPLFSSRSLDVPLHIAFWWTQKVLDCFKRGPHFTVRLPIIANFSFPIAYGSCTLFVLHWSVYPWPSLYCNNSVFRPILAFTHPYSCRDSDQDCWYAWGRCSIQALPLRVLSEYIKAYAWIALQNPWKTSYFNKMHRSGAWPLWHHHTYRQCQSKALQL